MRTAILYSEKLREYDLGHVLKGDRYGAFMKVFQEKLGDHPAFQVVEPPSATHRDLMLVHQEDYIKRVERCESRDPDTPLNPGIIRATKLMAGAGKLAGELVHSGKYQKAAVIGGGVQHAGRHYEKGFGVFSDVGICGENLMKNYGVKKVLILDFDAHAGDGIYQIFAEDPRVLFISLHQDTRTLYPGPSYDNPMGEGEGLGYSINVPLPPRTGDDAYEYILDHLIFPLAREFQPEIILMVDGSDPHFIDRITQMGVTLQGLYMIGDRVRQIAREITGSKVVSFNGSGYDPKGILFPLGWLASLGGLTGVEISLEEPYPLPPDHSSDRGLERTKKIVEGIKERYSPYWKCLADN